jgi:hypothetical protein
LGTRRVFGKQTDLRKSRYSEEERKEVSDNLARDFEYYFAQILKAANGKIFLM